MVWCPRHGTALPVDAGRSRHLPSVADNSSNLHPANTLSRLPPDLNAISEPVEIKSLRAISEHFRHTATRIYQQIALVWDIVTRAVLGTSLNTCVAPTAAHA